MLKNENGSVAIEAVLSISVTMVLLITLFGTLLSVYLEEESSWVAMQTIEDMGVLSMPFMGHTRFIEEEVNRFALTELAKVTLNRHIDEHHLSTILKNHDETTVDFDTLGFAELTFKVQFNLLTLNSVRTIVLPMSASVFSDDHSFTENLVYITTYGEKYHLGTCYHLRQSKFGIARTLAIEKGYEACKTCYGKGSQFE